MSEEKRSAEILDIVRGNQRDIGIILIINVAFVIITIFLFMLYIW